MQGHIRPRGPGAYELKFDVVSDAGERRTRYATVRGSKRDAQRKLTELLNQANQGTLIDTSRLTLAGFLDRWEKWAVTQIGAKTLERYTELLAHHVRPHLGGLQIQKLKVMHLAELYARLQRAKPEGAGLAPRTIGHVHRVMRGALGQAVKWGVLGNNPVSAAAPPRVQRTEIEILGPDQTKAVLDALRGRPLYPVALIGLATGMRRGEMVALRWRDVDLDAGKIRVAQSIEQTNAGLAFKAPKTKAGRRTVSIPRSIVAELRDHWRRQQEQRLALGMGKAGSDDLVLARPDGNQWPPDSLSADWAREMRRLELPQITLHGLRHSHVSGLIASGLDVVTVSRRIGHSNANVTLAVYAHLFGDTDQRAAAAVENSLAGVLAPA